MSTTRTRRPATIAWRRDADGMTDLFASRRSERPVGRVYRDGRWRWFVLDDGTEPTATGATDVLEDALAAAEQAMRAA
jgi:hypothetical protein